MAGWGQGFFEGAGTLAGSIGEGLLAAFRPDDPRRRNPTGLTPEQFAALQQGQPATPPPRPGLGESLLGLTPLGAAADAWKASDTAGAGGYEGGRATATALGNLAMLMVPGSKALKGAAREAAPIRAYHGSPHSFDRFDASKINTGEGAQAYGHGLYFAEREGVAREYRNQLSSPDGPKVLFAPTAENRYVPILSRIKEMTESVGDGRGMSPDEYRNAIIGHMEKSLEGAHPYAADFQRSAIKALTDGDIVVTPANLGHMYEVGIHADPARFLDWDKPLSAQSGDVQRILKDAWLAHPDAHANQTGSQIYNITAKDAAPVRGADNFDHQAAANILQREGIPGIRYLDQGSRTPKILFDGNPVPKGNLAAEQAAEMLDRYSPKEAMSILRGVPDGWGKQASMEAADLIEKGRIAKSVPAGTSNYVVFPGNEKLIEILRKYGLLPAAALPAAAAVPGLLSQPGEQ